MTASAHPGPPTDPPDFDGWVAARGAALIRFSYVLTGELSEADDLVQEGLASAYAQWDRLQGSDLLESRVQAVAARTYVRARQRHRRAKPDAAGDVWLPTPDSAGRPDRDSAEIWRRCTELTRRQRAVLVLTCYERLGPGEVAQAIGCRERTVRSELRRALATVAGSAARRTDAQARAVRQALLEYAELAPPSFSAGDRAVVRARHRRRRRLALGGALAAVVVAPLAWAGVTGAGTAPTSAPPRPRLDPSAVDFRGWRWESWGGVQLQVPGDWGHGDLTQWCVAGGTSGPAVDRPETDSTDVLCSLHDNGRTTYTGGVLLRRDGEGPRLSRADVAPYATTRIHTVGGVTITVVDIAPAVGSAILASAEVVGGRDYNGCRPEHPREPATPSANRSPDGPVTNLGAVTAVSVCRYGLTGWPRPTLISSRRLTDASADAVLAGLRAAPVQPPSSAPGACRARPEEFAVLELWETGEPGGPTSVVVRYDGCRRHGVDDGVSMRGLTAGVLKPVLLPPWTGRLTADVRRVFRGG